MLFKIFKQVFALNVLSTIFDNDAHHIVSKRGFQILEQQTFIQILTQQNMKKDLIINGIKYATYEFGYKENPNLKNALFIHIYHDVNPTKGMMYNEDFIISIVELVENKSFTMVGYLNIK